MKKNILSFNKQRRKLFATKQIVIKINVISLLNWIKRKKNYAFLNFLWIKARLDDMKYEQEGFAERVKDFKDEISLMNLT